MDTVANNLRQNLNTSPLHGCQCIDFRSISTITTQCIESDKCDLILCMGYNNLGPIICIPCTAWHAIWITEINQNIQITNIKK